jgi:hypothetical protein
MFVVAGAVEKRGVLAAENVGGGCILFCDVKQQQQRVCVCVRAHILGMLEV